ncbi:uncharacterized protein LOC132946257 isoform X2 [Metopolophium dirhodum]|uniref:uncharacterized protein LOC132946257 isoform X2 n=1 Tax=Metopolophium dirhodum TaxID=44670 RepID=UPI00299061F3|nr:uncharacterized protein LOC132946257 isoform X2 [Metopolophium dirhodum]
MGMSKRTALLSAVIVTFGLGTLYLGLNMKTPRPPKDPNSWDILIFTQTWPNTLCYSWKRSNPAHTCNLPSDKNIWTVHGVWPTKLGTVGPGFCNKSLVFNPASIYGIKDKLNQYWTDIEIPPSNTTEGNFTSIDTSHKKESIYFHEWEKHGTCAVALPALDSEFKYFYQGIEWSEKYNMRDVLDKSNIKINSTFHVDDYWKAVKSVLKTNAWIECETKHDTKEQMLAEIRICFDKTLKLIDCDGIMKPRKGPMKKSHALTNCDTKKPILYLDHVPELNISTNTNSTNSNSTSTDAILTNPNSTVDDKEWDILVFSQSWPYTFCHTWTVNSNTHTCNLPANRNQWTIHGIWPSKIGAFGPSFCNNQTTFNLNALNTIIPELKNRWTEIKESKTWTRKQEGELWRHEWIKHGTCSKSLPTLDSELKYFNQGLDWSKQYVLSDLLEQGGIKPNGSYPITQIWHTLRTGLGKNPHIDCYYESRTNKPYIDEVRICFNKSLELIDCDPFRRNSNKPSTNCPLDKEIFYIGAVV